MWRFNQQCKLTKQKKPFSDGERLRDCTEEAARNSTFPANTEKKTGGSFRAPVAHLSLPKQVHATQKVQMITPYH